MAEAGRPALSRMERARPVDLLNPNCAARFEQSAARGRDIGACAGNNLELKGVEVTLERTAWLNIVNSMRPAKRCLPIETQRVSSGSGD